MADLSRAAEEAEQGVADAALLLAAAETGVEAAGTEGGGKPVEAIVLIASHSRSKDGRTSRDGVANSAVVSAVVSTTAGAALEAMRLASERRGCSIQLESSPSSFASRESRPLERSEATPLAPAGGQFSESSSRPMLACSLSSETAADSVVPVALPRCGGAAPPPPPCLPLRRRG